MPANRIRYDSERMRAAAHEIRGMIDQYAAAASRFVNDFNSATAAWEGASKQKTQAFVEGPMNQYLTSTVGQLLDAMAQLLEANADQMEQADEEIANNIPDSLG